MESKTSLLLSDAGNREPPRAPPRHPGPGGIRLPAPYLPASTRSVPLSAGGLLAALLPGRLLRKNSLLFFKLLSNYFAKCEGFFSLLPAQICFCIYLARVALLFPSPRSDVARALWRGSSNGILLCWPGFHLGRSILVGDTIWSKTLLCPTGLHRVGRGSRVVGASAMPACSSCLPSP